jgi:hypothetical protein
MLCQLSSKYGDGWTLLLGCSNREYVDILKRKALAAILYAVRFTRRRHPDEKVITRVEQRLVDTGHFNPLRGMDGSPPSMSWQEEELELDMAADQPGISARALARRHNLSKQWYVPTKVQPPPILTLTLTANSRLCARERASGTLVPQCVGRFAWRLYHWSISPT